MGRSFVTEGTGHVIDPAGDARRVLQDAVASHGPEVLSDATVMDHLSRTQLAALPGESILIVSAGPAAPPGLTLTPLPPPGARRRARPGAFGHAAPSRPSAPG